ncbi:hypothetical protein BaRGS_00036369 [Batillaria attramentaria]|uniref:RNA polymerase II-associated protein 1 n=1 Tax=Batillaria attramentaria TaxID=370345 RepID=A0ABD0JC42_9CAEN
MERPKRGEDEDELLQFQQEFLASKASPSVSVVKKADKRKPGDTDRDVVHMETLPAAEPTFDPAPPKKSRFRAGREKKVAQESGEGASSTAASAFSVEDIVDKHEEGMAAVLTSIIERDTRNSAFSLPRPVTQPFPSVTERHVTEQPAPAGGKKQSLFARQIQEQGVRDFGVMLQEERVKMDTGNDARLEANSAPVSVQQTDTTSHFISGLGLSASQAEEEARSIHQENLHKLSDMSEQEILEEQQKLLQMLDPQMVEFLKSKSKTAANTGVPSKPKPKHGKGKAKPPPQDTANTQSLPEDVAMVEKERWLHMDKIEYDKLEWMKDLPLPSAGDVQTGQQARFDFRGNVVPADADVPVTTGLHHHGDEPERAGYTLEELFTLARSSNIQQRGLALNTLGYITQKAKQGMLEDFVQTPILPTILDGGVIFLLRWACDDSVDSVVASAIFALNALLCNPADEEALDETSSWYQGLVTPSLLPARTAEMIEEKRMGEQNEDNSEQETDADMAKRDLILGLVDRMLLLQRLHYILDSTHPQAPTVVGILEILTRVAQHSMQLAYEVGRSAKLMSLIFSQFLPTTWEPQDAKKPVSAVYGVPVPAAMRLVGCLCQAGRHIASSLLASYPLPNVLLRYLAVSSVNLQLSPREAENLQRESLKTWRILLSYGLAADVYLELQGLVSRLSDVGVHKPSDWDVGLAAVLESVLPVAALPAVKHRFNQKSSETVEEDMESPINWSHVDGTLPLIKLASERWLHYLAENYALQKPSLQLPTACLNFLATYYSKFEGQPTVNMVECLQQVEQWCSDSLLPFLNSFGFNAILAKLSSSSNLLCPSTEKRKEVSSCLPQFGCDRRESSVPVVGASSPFGFLLALCRLVYVLCKLHKDLITEVASTIVNHEDVVSYMRKVSFCPHAHLHSNCFTRFENILQYYIIRLASLTTGDEYLAHDLMSTVLFNPDFIPSHYQQMPMDVDSLVTHRIGEYLMPHDWVFLPLVELYNQTASVESSAQNNLSAAVISMVTSVLQWIFMLESWRRSALSHVSVTLKISRVMCVFLAGNDLFLEKSIYPYLASLFRCYTTPQLLDKMDFEENIPGISSFYDLYMLFLDQYEAVSFGDAVFGAFVLLPMQQSQSCLLRRAVWQERANLLRTLSIPVKEMLIAIERYLTPDETDVQLIQLYVGALLSGSVRHRWSPVLFLVAVHHTNRFLYYTQDTDHQDVRQRLWSRVLHCKDEDLRRTILHYKRADTSAQDNMELYSELPANRQKVFRDFQSQFNAQDTQCPGGHFPAGDCGDVGLPTTGECGSDADCATVDHGDYCCANHMCETHCFKPHHQN